MKVPLIAWTSNALQFNSERATRFSTQRVVLESILVSLVAALFLYPTIIQKSTLFIDDGLFHFQLARLIWEQGPWVDVSWLPLTVLGKNGPDHHWLWHTLISPFAMIADPELGLRWSILTTAAVVPGLLNALARALRIPFAPVLALLAVTAGIIVPVRLVMLRAQNLAILLLPLAITLDLRQRWLWLAICAFAFMQSYHGAVLLVPIAALICALRLFLLGEWQWRGIASVATGLVLGLVASPWVPKNVEYLMFHLFFKGSKVLPAEVGTEWNSLSWDGMWFESKIALLFYLGAIILTIGMSVRHRDFRRRFESIAWLAVTAMFLVMYKNAWRFAEYFVPFATLVFGLTIRDFFTFGDKKFLQALVCMALIACLQQTSEKGLAYLDYSSSSRLDMHRDIAQYLDTHAHMGELVFNSNWSDFTNMMWHTRKFSYATGLDGHFLAYENPKKYLVLLSLCNNVSDTKEDPAVLIRDTFGTRWAMISPRHSLLANALANSPNARLAIRAQSSWLFELSGRQ